MKNLFKITVLTITIISLVGTVAFASSNDYGATGASNDSIYTLEEMLQYALEDEYMAEYEYEAIINELEAGRPFTNIIEAEKVHISEVEALYNALGIEIPVVDPSDMVVIPATIEEALALGVEAEIANIAMYEQFLAQELPDDVRDTFEALKSGSESHLAAFSRTQGRGVTGNGQQQKGNRDMNGTQAGNINGKGQGGAGSSDRGQGMSNKEAGNRMNQNNDETCTLN